VWGHAAAVVRWLGGHGHHHRPPRVLGSWRLGWPGDPWLSPPPPRKVLCLRCHSRVAGAMATPPLHGLPARGLWPRRRRQSPYGRPLPPPVARVILVGAGCRPPIPRLGGCFCTLLATPSSGSLGVVPAGGLSCEVAMYIGLRLWEGMGWRRKPRVFLWDNDGNAPGTIYLF